MPNCYQLFPIGETEAEFLQVVDEKMCEHFERPCDKERWFGDWHNSTGLRLAMGSTFDEIKVAYNGYIDKSTDDAEIMFYCLAIQIVDWLKANYTTTAWYQHK